MQAIALNRWLGEILVVLAVLLALTGCKERGEKAPPPGSVKANGAFLQHFGQPPVPQQGTCFARVGYFPLAGEPGRLRAVPLFIFREEGQLAHLLAAYTGNNWEFPPQSGLLNPFPPGTSIRISNREDDRVTIDLTAPGADGSPEEAGRMSAALTETVLQYEDIKRVFLIVNGTAPANMPGDGFRHDPGRIASPGSPGPLMVGGNWEKGEKDPEEIFINFDRPVTVEEIRLLDAAGQEMEGDFFQTGFDMTVVLLPAAPQAFLEGMPLRVAWQVDDRLGRASSGEQQFLLKRFEEDEEKALPDPGKRR
ncbi:MAG: hypothetical protein C4563_09120 [Desulfobulbus sp.]|nr:MAG: hypothetical protein C4563_09120 [Desulfobulbus sp.]